MKRPFWIRSLNVRGIRNPIKRSNIFAYLKGKLKNNKMADIFILVDTHCHSGKDASTWGEEWSSNEEDSIWSKGTKNQKGVAILINENFRRQHPNLIIGKPEPDSNGRYIKCFISVFEQKFRLLAVYAPPKGHLRIPFFQNLMDVILDDIDDAQTIMGGDWNCTENTELDRLNCVGTNDLGRIDLNYIKELFDLEDVWRRRYPDTKDFTWSGKGKMSRIDYFLISVSLDVQIENIYHSFAPFTDHKAVDIFINIDPLTRGPGIWKMNSEILLNNDFRDGFTDLWKKWKDQKQFYTDKKRWWDIGKLHIKSYTQQFSKEYNFNQNTRLEYLEEQINKKKKADADYNRLQKEYEDIFANKTQGIRIRSKVKEWEEGEKSSKYFYSLEKRNAKEKGWDKIWDKNKQILVGTSNIQKRQLEFYQDLYTSQNLMTSNEDYDYFFNSTICDKKICDESKNFLDGDITSEEIHNSLKKTKNNKSPGPDGIIFEFYKLYWNIIGEDLCEALKLGLEDKELSYTQYLATIVLLYKKGPRQDIRNWRPISLLNTDYKILSKVLAERLKPVLKEIIHPDQKGCVPDRLIGQNIRLIDDILYEMEIEDMDGLILQLDQEKAFDRVEWNWLFKCLENFNFGEKFISYLKTLYKNSKSSILTNGYQSRYFDITRGIRQGDSLSALLFIIQFEPLMNKIRKENSIEGIEINLKYSGGTITTKGCQYVDDSNSTIKDFNSLEKFFCVIKNYESVSGSKVNMGKTKCISHKVMSNNPYEEFFKITTDQEIVLGVAIGKERNNNAEFWNSKIDKVKGSLNAWEMRNLSYIGKSLVIRSMAISQVAYACEMTPITEEHRKIINKLIYKFLWSGKNVKIKKSIVSLPRHLGGLNVVDLDILIKTKRIMWVIRALKDNSDQTCTKLTENYLRCLDNEFDILFFALKVSDSRDLTNNPRIKIPNFYRECIDSFQEFNRIALIQNDKEEDIVWCNSRFLFNNKPLVFKHWSKAGIKLVGDLYDKDLNINYNLLRAKLTTNQSWIQNLCQKAAFIFEISKIKKIFPRKAVSVPRNTNLIHGGKRFLLEQKYHILNLGQKTLENITSKDIYNTLLLHDPPEIRSKTYWSNKFPDVTFDFDKWIQVNMNNKFLPNKIKDFNWKIFHGLINTGTKLKLMGFSDGTCRVCRNGTIENVEHFIYDCNTSKLTWQQIQKITREWLKKRDFELNKLKTITGFWETDIDNEAMILNTLFGLVRYFIWKKRCKAQYDNLIINSVSDICNGLKFYILDHLQTLIYCKTVDAISKEKVALLSSIIENHNWN